MRLDVPCPGVLEVWLGRLGHVGCLVALGYMYSEWLILGGLSRHELAWHHLEWTESVVLNETNDTPGAVKTAC
eukprot:scaffold143436_cov73-Attheya_sp.AAC.1